MITDAFFNLLKGLIDGLFAILPHWEMSVDNPCGDANSANCHPEGPAVIRFFFQLLIQWDKVLPVHDFALPATVITFNIVFVVIVLKGLIQLVNIIRGAGA
jgi:hypothetical protein